MRYTKEEKVKWVRMYKASKPITMPTGVSRASFMVRVRAWTRLHDMFGPESLEHRYFAKEYSAEDKIVAVRRVLAGETYTKVANSMGMACISVVLNWHRIYMKSGWVGLESIRKGRRPNMPKAKIKRLSKSEKEELNVLRARNDYLEAENEYLKKLDALVQEREQAQAKATKRVRSNHSVKKG